LTNVPLGDVDILVVWVLLMSDLETELSNVTDDVESFVSLWLPLKVLLIVWDNIEDTLKDFETLAEVLISNGDLLVLRSGKLGDIDSRLSESTGLLDGLDSWALPFEVHLLLSVWKQLDDVVEDVEGFTGVLVSDSNLGVVGIHL